MTGPAAKVRVEIDRVEIRRVLSGETGMVVPFIRDVTREVRNRAVLRCPVDTGNLRNSHYERVEVSEHHVVGVVGTDVEYAAYVHDGTRPHVIRPRRPGGVLRFSVGGKVVFSAYARHPGTRAQPWLRESVEEVAIPRGFVVRR